MAAGLWIGASFAGSDKPGDFDGEVWRDFNGQFLPAAAALGYLDLAEIAVGAYDDARVAAYVREAETAGVQEHGFPRLAADIAQLVAAGRLPEKKPLLDRMMTLACASARKGKMPPKGGGNDFTVRELVTAVIALEKAKAFPSEKIAAWKADLAAIEAKRCYSSPSWFKPGESEGRNWPLFAAASEQARIKYGFGGDPKFVETWVSDQLRHFDRNGMYRDPHEPANYDFVGRICYMMILHFGYDGPCRAKIEEELLAAAEPTLAMLSVCGEIPYGGRSNQFLHNNTLYAAIAEWYAAFFARRGDAEKAARFRDAAARAVAALEPWVKDGKVFHVKNRYPKPETKGARNIDQKWFGCENYAYFDKYMITMGSWAVMAAEFAGEGRGQRSRSTVEDRIHCSPSPFIFTFAPSSFATSEHFHWKFANSKNYTVQEDWNANLQYDATGIGRIHRRGAPPAICLSTPCAEKPNYFIGAEKNPGPLAIAAAGGKMTYEASDAGVAIRVSRTDNEPTTTSGASLALPVFEFDGEEATRVEFSPKLVKVFYRGWVCRYATRGGTFVETGLRYFNRNGRYRRIDCTGGNFTVYVTIEREDRGACICGVAPERDDDFYWENDRAGFRAYGPGDYHKWSGIDLFIKNTPSNAVERLLREPDCHGDWHKNENPLAYDNFAVGAGRGCGAVAIFADGEWKTIPNWKAARVLHEGDDYLEFELVYPAVCALGEMTYRITMKKGDDFFRNDVSFEFPERMGKGWIVRPEVKEDPSCAAKPFLRFDGGGTKANISYEAGYVISSKEVRTIDAVAAPTPEELVARAKKGPSLLLTREMVPVVRARIANNRDAAAWFAEFRAELDARRAKKPEIYDRGGQWTMWLNCRKCAARLVSESPTRHVCPACGEVHSGWPYDDAYISKVNNANGHEIRDCGVAWLVTGERKYADRARDILLAYARVYGGYEWHQRNGPEKPGRCSAARAYAQVLDEAVWLCDVLDGYDAVADALTEAERTTIREKLLRPSTATVRSECCHWSNHEVWHLAAFGRAGLVLGDAALVEAALYGRYGAINQLEHGILADGTWYEGSMHYHFYTMRAFTPFFRVLRNLGHPVPEKYRAMFLGPIAQVAPDGMMPPVNDSCSLEYLRPGDLPQHYEYAHAWWNDAVFGWWVRQQPRRSMEYALWGRDAAGPVPTPPAPASCICKGSGLAVLRSRTPGAEKAGWIPDNCLMLDFGPHGEWHGHPDKLNVFFWLHGELVSEDPGGINYGSARHWGWYKSTLAHNELRVDGVNQGMGEAELVAFVTNGNASAVAAFCPGSRPATNYWDGPVYKGVDVLRATALVGDVVLDYVEADSATEHDYEWCFHARGDLTPPEGVSLKPMTGVPKRYEMKSYDCPPLLKGDESWAWVEKPVQGLVANVWRTSWKRPSGTFGLWQKASAPGVFATGVASALPPPAQLTLAVNKVRGKRAVFASVGVPDAAAKVEIGEVFVRPDGSRGFEATVNGIRHRLTVRRGVPALLEIL